MSGFLRDFEHGQNGLQAKLDGTAKIVLEMCCNVSEAGCSCRRHCHHRRVVTKLFSGFSSSKRLWLKALQFSDKGRNISDQLHPLSRSLAFAEQHKIDICNT